MLTASKVTRAALALLAVGLVSLPAQARRVQIDFDGFGFSTSGENFSSAAPDNHFGTGSGEMPFFLNLGAGAQAYDFCMNINGFVSFVASGSPCASGNTPTGDYIAPFLSSLTPNGSNTLFGVGVVDTTLPYVAGDAKSAIRFVWDTVDSALNPVLAELVMVDKGGGDFSFEFRYGNNDFGVDGAPATGTQGFSLGTAKSGPLSGPFSTDANYAYSVDGGVCTPNCNTTTEPPPTTVSEPSMGTLAALAFGLLALFGYHTRRRRTAARKP